MDSNSSGFVCLGWVGYLVVYLSAPACCLLHLAPGTWHLHCMENWRWLHLTRVKESQVSLVSQVFFHKVKVGGWL